MNEKSVMFACHTYYHLYISSVYAKHLREKNIRSSLIWYGNIDNPFINRLRDVFDTTYNVGNIYKNEVNPSKESIVKLLNLRVFSLLRYIIIFGISVKEFAVLKTSKLCIFSDVPVEAQFLMTMSKRYNKNSKNIMIDEGIGLYLNKAENKIYTKKFYRILNIFKFRPLDNIAMGEHSLLDAIIAKEPNELPANITERDITIIKQSIKSIFGIEECSWFLKHIKLDTDQINQKKRKIILFIGQPLKFIGIDEKKEIEFWMEIFRRIPDEYTVFIKPHPADTKNKYKRLMDVHKDVKILGGEYSLIPIELLFGSFNKLITISAFSSATTNSKYINGEIKNILAYKMLNVDKYHESNIINNLLSKNGVTLNSISELSNLFRDFPTNYVEIETINSQIEDDINDDLEILTL